MKLKYLCFSLLIMGFTQGNAQINSSLWNDFEDGTTQGWSNGVNSPNPPVNLPCCGPSGSDDNILEETSSGGTGAGSKWVIFNTNSEWLGDYIAAEIRGIIFDFKNTGAAPLNLRVGFQGGPDDSRAVSTDASIIQPNQTEWGPGTLLMTPDLLTQVSGSSTIEEILADVTEIRIFSNPAIAWEGESVLATAELDNISAQEILSSSDNGLKLVRLFPNPTTQLLTISSEENVNSYRIYNVSGALISEGKIENQPQQIDVSSVSSGIYFAELISGDIRTTQKFIKQ